MLRLFVCLVRNEDGFTAVECGILGCLTVIFAEKFIAPFEPPHCNELGWDEPNHPGLRSAILTR